MKSLFKGAALSACISSVLLLTCALAGCGTPRAAHPADPQKGGSTDLLRPGDAVYISFSGVIEPPPRVEDRIRENGCITLPFVGEVQAAGLTRSLLQERVHALYVPKLYKRLTVSVNPDIRYFYVSGQVKREGSIPYVGGMTVLKAIAAAGGFTDFAKKGKVQITRADGKVETVDCDRAQRDSGMDLTVFPDDQIYVPRRLF